MNLNIPRFSSHSVKFAFSNAFFEHLYRKSRTAHLKAVCSSLESGGVCCYIGIPYFRNVARCYLEGTPGTCGPVFNLFNVYRYTHGDPEQVSGWWTEQLHKSLFDEDELAALLNDSGFGAYVLFCYPYPGDSNELPVTMGFFASREAATEDRLRTEALSFLKQFDDKRIRLNRLQWLTPTGSV